MDGLGTPGRGRWPLGLFGMLVLVALVERGLVRGQRHTSDKAVSWSFAASAIEREARSAQVVVFGDSMMKFGVLPRVIEARSGARAYNLALFDGPPLASLALFERLLAEGGRPGAVLLNVMPHHLSRSLHDRKHSGVWNQIMGWSSAWGVARRFGAYSLLADFVYTGALPSLAAREELRATVLAAFEGRARSTLGIARLYEQNWRANLGAHVLAQTGVGKFQPNNHELEAVAWKPRQENLAVLRRFFDTAKAHGVRVYVLISPMHPGAQARLAAIGLYARYEKVVRALQGEYAGVTILDGRTLNLAADQFVDGVHLNRAGAIALSAACGDALAAGDRGGWVRLAPSGESGRDFAIEDIAESRMVLRDERAARRK